MDLRVDLGRRIREHRQRRNLTLKQLESRIELSSTHISEIERGKVSPTIGVLDRIARAFELDPAVFLADEQIPDAVVVRKADRRRIAMPDEGMELHTLSGGIPEVSVLLLEWAPGTESRLTRSHAGEELGLVLDGALEIQIEDEIYGVRAGESIHFKASRAHWIGNPHDEPCRAIWATTPRFGL